ncbi:MAG: hypothetical protein KGL39_16465 [Patescibacteria group bacterium]|nr:hypothetical protein [Patescibacteria group bacterium]
MSHTEDLDVSDIKSMARSFARRFKSEDTENLLQVVTSVAGGDNIFLATLVRWILAYMREDETLL